LARHGWLALLVLCVVAGASVLSTAELPEGLSAGSAPAALLYAWCTSGALALAYVVAGGGYAPPLGARLAPAMALRWVLQAALGVGVMLWLSHVLGCFGLLSGLRGQAVAIGVLAGGLALAGVQAARGWRRGSRPARTPPWSLLLAPGACVLALAA